MNNHFDVVYNVKDKKIIDENTIKNIDVITDINEIKDKNNSTLIKKKDSDIESDDRYYEDDDSDYNEFSETKYKDFLYIQTEYCDETLSQYLHKKDISFKKRWIFVYKFYME